MSGSTPRTRTTRLKGITKENHGPYCRDAVRALLQACPAISGVTFRVHGESGVEEGSYEFWKTVFDGVATCGRTVEIDMHAKGMDETMQNLAVATKMPVKISPKYWAEHMGMPYHQADIRELEQPKPGRSGNALMKFSAGSRSFLRYGYGDLLREDRPWGVLHRIWPGTQRLLLWADPVTAGCALARIHVLRQRRSGDHGTAVVQRTTRIRHRRRSLRLSRREPEAALGLAEVRIRHSHLGPFALQSRRGCVRMAAVSHANSSDRALRLWRMPLANASRILPIITTAHGTSAGNNTYWPEVYLNQSMIDGDHPGPYRDTPVPRVFGNVSPLDPQLFSTINEFRGRVAERRSERQVLADRGRAVAGRLCCQSRRESGQGGEAQYGKDSSRVPPDGDRRGDSGRTRPVLRREVPQRGAVPDL